MSFLLKLRVRKQIGFEGKSAAGLKRFNVPFAAEKESKYTDIGENDQYLTLGQR